MLIALISDPSSSVCVDDWRGVQEEMLRQYLATAECDLRAKQELVDIKQQRLHLAQDEYNHLSNTLANLNASTTSREYLDIYYINAIHYILVQD